MLQRWSVLLFALVLAGCNAPKPWPPDFYPYHRAPGPVTTADEAIRIAHAQCGGRPDLLDHGAATLPSFQRGEWVRGYWSAERSGNNWVVSFSQTDPKTDLNPADKVIVPVQDGIAVGCMQRFSVS